MDVLLELFIKSGNMNYSRNKEGMLSVTVIQWVTLKKIYFQY